MDKNKRKTIEGWLDKANNQLDAAKQHLSRFQYSEAVQASQECIELSVKSILSFLEIDYPRSHQWKQDKEQFLNLARQIKSRNILDKLEQLYMRITVPLPRLIFLMNFWSESYSAAKYGLEAEHLASAKELLKIKESELAIQHAEECYHAAMTIRFLSDENLAILVSKK